MADGTHVDTIPEVEPVDGHGEVPQGHTSKIPRFPSEVYVDGYRVYYVRDKKDGTFWQQYSDGKWQQMPNPETMEHVDLRDLEPFARDPKETLVSIYEGDDPDEWIRRHNAIASLDGEPLVSVCESNLDCTGDDRTTHNTMLLHFTRALTAIIIGMNVFCEGKHHCALLIKKRIVHACIATIYPDYNDAKTCIKGFKFAFRIEVAKGVYERWTHSSAGVAVGVFGPTEDEKKLLGIDPADERIAFVVLPTTKDAWNGQEFPERFHIRREDMREFYEKGRVTSKPKNDRERLMFAGMCFEKDLRRKVDAAGALDVEWINDQKTLFPLDMTGRLKAAYSRQWLPLADALAASSKKRAEKEATLKEKLKSRKVVKHPDVEKPDDFKPYVPPAPKEKKEKPPPKKYNAEKTERFKNVDYGRPYTKRRRRRDQDGDAEEGEGL